MSKSVEEFVTVLVEMCKRDFSTAAREKDAKSGAALPDGSYPIVNESDLKNAMQALGRASNRAEVIAHIKARAKALGLESVLKGNAIYS